jgi:hypothetical protein
MPVAVARAACAPFERRHALLEHGDGWIGETRILIARLLVGESLLGLQRGVVDVALGHEQGFARLAELGAQRAGMNEAGFGAVTPGGERGHL